MKFLCGTYFKHQCRVRLTDYKDARTPEFCVQIEDELQNDYVFCKPEMLGQLSIHAMIGAIKLPDGFTLVTHNSDINFGEEEINHVIKLFPKMGQWYTQNLMFDHPKVKPIPIGIANPKWSHGNQDRFVDIASKELKKIQNVYVNFNVSTNPQARSECLEKIGFPYNLQLEKNYPNASSIKDHDNFVETTQERYLTDMASSYFTLSPVGNGVDCHKTWESIYMKSVPIVTRWHGVEKFQKLGIPMLIIDNWSDFKNLNLSEDLYNELWQDFDVKSLDFNLFK